VLGNDKIIRLRSFAESVKRMIPSERVSSLAADPRTKKIVLEKALEYVNHNEDDFFHGLQVMTLVTTLQLSREDVDNVVWDAIAFLCVPATTALPPGEFEPTSPPSAAVMPKEEEHNEPIVCGHKRRKIQDDEEEMFRSRIEKTISASMGRKPVVETLGMQFLACKHQRMAAKGRFHGLLTNLDLLEHIGAPIETIARLFEKALVGGKAAGRVPTPERLQLDFSEDRFTKTVIRVYCRDPRLNVSPQSVKASLLAERMLRKAREGGVQSIDHTVGFFELAGVDRKLIGTILSKACGYWKTTGRY
jgi:hypothetical protein